MRNQIRVVNSYNHNYVPINAKIVGELVHMGSSLISAITPGHPFYETEKNKWINSPHVVINYGHEMLTLLYPAVLYNGVFYYTERTDILSHPDMIYVVLVCGSDLDIPGVHYTISGIDASTMNFSFH